ncbi:carotenoid oxygenase family protein [Rhodococcus sp. (in: high G+C Gram-positive bacteria)]|uniref:carotenoid oxygenase family protein n=1 Tax=Rhodococcus sp. TaxID=1831 RepID=UPI00257FE298|nr:carotenoid oxygenase family protein [Rhodococcus sp. (in: high G+C Gram-positive bacteria)]MBQ9053037.1 carotenoid oxygenase family protein [Rhodococcus sp. (in: high G+C Gram-positive bacteria)]
MSDTEKFHPQLAGNYAPITAESDAPDLPVTEGQLPDGLNGVLYRNSTNPMYPPLNKDDHHWFLSEGMVHAVFVRNGKVSYRNRWVQTDQYLAQRDAGRRLVSTGLNTPSLPEGETISKHFAATHALYHGEKLLALDEWAKPAALDGESLETLFETWDFYGAQDGPFTAHPKLDPDTGELIGFGYQAAGPGTSEMSYTVVDPTGHVTRHDHFEVPFCSVIHDFGVTSEHIIFPLFPADVSIERIQKGGPLVAFNPELGTHFGILRRDADISTIRWFRGDPCFAFHTMNAYTEVQDGHTKVVLDMMKFPNLPLFPDVNGENIPQWIRDGDGIPVRWTFDLESDEDTYTEEVLSDLKGEFPAIDNRYAGKPYTTGFYSAYQNDEWIEGAFHDTIVQLDLKTGNRREYHPGGGQYFLETVFVPRNEDAAEADGWLLTLSYSTDRNLSDFLVFDTTDITQGPIARVELPTRVPYGFHGSWRPFSE